MRERLIATMVGLTLAVITLYGVPRAYVLADQVRDQEELLLSRTADHVALLVLERERAGGTVGPTLLGSALAEGERAEYTTPGGGTVLSGTPVPADDGEIVETRELGNGATLTLRRSGSVVGEKVTDAIQPLVAIGLGLAIISAVVGYLLARRISRPFLELAGTATALGRGEFDLTVPRYSVPEADQIGSALLQAGAELDTLVRREREFAVNASHQLRTPITALRLELEDLSLWPETPPTVAAQLDRSLGELDRLSAAIDELLDLARGQRRAAAVDADLAALVAESAARWRARFEDAGRRVVVRADGPLRVRLATGLVGQILDVLLDNARLHGEGTVRVDVRAVDNHAEVVVADEGSRSFGVEVFQRGVSSKRMTGEGTGVGLTVAAELAEVCGGRLTVDERSATTAFRLLLPGS